MELLYESLSALLSTISEYWLIFLLLILSFRRYNRLIRSLTVSIILSLIILNRISGWFIFFWCFLLYCLISDGGE